ncbi:hypothetical protein, partial [Escherichia coli]|uniref:hypothetical protein n=1 Tax=Escherichia coli TaxID=562 RepID=UPI002237D2C1
NRPASGVVRIFPEWHSPNLANYVIDPAFSVIRETVRFLCVRFKPVSERLLNRPTGANASRDSMIKFIADFSSASHARHCDAFPGRFQAQIHYLQSRRSGDIQLHCSPDPKKYQLTGHCRMLALRCQPSLKRLLWLVIRLILKRAVSLS